MSNIIETIAKRSSTRSYTTETLTDEELNLLVTAGLQAPTASNKREIHFTVLKGNNPILKEIDDEKNRLKEASASEHNFYYEAPAVIVISADSEFKWSSLDAGIAVENIALAAEGVGLGNLIIGCIYDVLRGEKKEYFSKLLAFPDGYEYKIAIAIGHKADEKKPHTYDAETQVSFL